MTPQTCARFWAKVDRCHGPRQPHMRSRCWPWTGAKHTKGSYGRMQVNGRDTLAHHVAFEVQVGTVPRGKCVLHRCDFPPCQRGSHLFTGTVLENNADRHAKGRSRGGRANAKLTEADVRRMRRLHRERGLGARRLAPLFPQVCVGNIAAVIYGDTWKHVAR